MYEASHKFCLWLEKLSTFVLSLGRSDQELQVQWGRHSTERPFLPAGWQAIDCSTLRQALAGVAAVTAGVPGTPRPPGLRFGGAGEDALDQQFHDRSAARLRANDQPEPWLAPANKDTQPCFAHSKSSPRSRKKFFESAWM